MHAHVNVGLVPYAYMHEDRTKMTSFSPLRLRSETEFGIVATVVTLRIPHQHPYGYCRADPRGGAEELWGRGDVAQTKNAPLRIGRWLTLDDG